MSTDEYTYLIYDKAVDNDHGYNNKLTKELTIESMFTSDNEYYEGCAAIKETKKFGEIYQLPEDLIVEKENDLYNVYLFHYLYVGAKINITIVAVNKKLLEQLVIKKQHIPHKDFLIKLCGYHILYNKVSNGHNILEKSSTDMKITETIGKIVKASMTANADPTDPIETQPNFAKIQLFDYQKRSVRWMLDREEKLEGVYYNLNDETKIGNIVYDTVKQDFILADNRQKLIFRGGALIDEVGLGKTYQMIIVSLCNQAKNINYVQDKYEKIFSKATLVICPNQLSGQWIRELTKVIKETYSITVLPLFTKNHFDKYTYQDLLDADFVITSFNFLGNQCFLSPWVSQLSKQKSYLTSVKYSHRDTHDLLKKMASSLKSKISGIIDVCPNLLLINWHRIIVDEFHEVFTVEKYNYLKKILPLFDSDYKWCMTATPFDKSDECLINMVDFITNYDNVASNPKSILANNDISEHLIKRFFRRNTKKSVEAEYELLPLKENIVWLNFSKTEWMMYNAYIANPNVDKFSVLVRQICCHPKIADEIKNALSNCKSLDDIEKMMVTHYETQMKKSNMKVKYIEYRLHTIRKKIKILEWKRQRKFLRLLNYKVKIDYNEEIINDINIKLFEQQLAGDADLEALFLHNSNNNKNEDPFESDSDDSEDYEENNNSKKKKKTIITISDENQDEILKIIGKDIYKNIPISITSSKEIEANFIAKLNLATKDYNGKKSTYDYYNDVMTRLKKTAENTKYTDCKMSDSDSSDSDDSDADEKETCAVCMGSIKGHDLGVTKCGHIFHYNCVKPFVEKQLKCPICQKACKSSEIYMITQVLPEEKNDKDFMDKQTLISKVGTKLGNLIFFLKKNNKHAIIFSQWDDLLKKVGDVLDDYGINNVFCKGNVWQRDKAIREFNSDKDIKVIMLSSESAASGTNLTKAEMVILLDPVYGTYEYRRNTEWQAIGRAYRMGQTKQVEVVRFIVKSTVEEEIYNLNKEKDKLTQSNIKISELTDDKIILEKEKIDEIVDAAKVAQKKKIEKPKKMVKKIAHDI
jgi:SNF2 family DNA or RNA helicase